MHKQQSVPVLITDASASLSGSLDDGDVRSRLAMILHGIAAKYIWRLEFTINIDRQTQVRGTIVLRISKTYTLDASQTYILLRNNFNWNVC